MKKCGGISSNEPGRNSANYFQRFFGAGCQPAALRHDARETTARAAEPMRPSEYGDARLHAARLMDSLQRIASRAHVEGRSQTPALALLARARELYFDVVMRDGRVGES